MTRKRVTMGLKPGTERSAEAWVGEKNEPSLKQPKPTITKRLTIDISEELHRTLKMKAAAEGVRMADLVRSWILENCEG
jgi:predicted HicB family RNase H-like nuclease